MPKIGILTFHWANHYGAVLQAYALQQLLRKIGYDSAIIDYKPVLSNVVSSTIKPKELGRKYKALGLPPIRTLKSIAGEIIYFAPFFMDEFVRSKAFNEFRKNVLRINFRNIVDSEHLKRECSNYATIIVGSDQVWNPEFLKFSNYDYLLPFELKNTFKVGFSTSIGIDVSTISKRVIALYKRYLKEFFFISLREKRHAVWLSKILGRDVYHTLDPTLLVNKEDFEEISRDIEVVPESYVLFYNLDVSILPFVEELEKELKLPVLIYRKPIIREWGVYGRYVRNRKSFYHVGPREFISLLKKAKLVFTDSFHGLTLSILFEKPVVAAIHDSSQRAKTKIRIEDLVELLGLKEIIVKDKNDIKNVLRTEVNYSDVKSKLSELRRNSLDLLKEALSTVMN